MNKMVYTLLVVKESCAKVESILQRYRIGLNDWDKTKELRVCDGTMINYTIICEPTTYEDIMSTYYGTL